MDEALFFCGLDTVKGFFSVAIHEPDLLVNQLHGVLDAFDIAKAVRSGDENKVLAFLTKWPIYRDQSLPAGQTVLSIAARAGHYALVRKLVDEQCCSVNAQNVVDHKTALHYSVERPVDALHLELIRYLLRRGADMFLVSKPGTAQACTPFSLALGTPASLSAQHSLNPFVHFSCKARKGT